MTPDLDAILAAADPRAYIAGLGDVIDVFDDQGSGCVSYGIATGGRRWFVKTANTRETVAMLRRARAFHQDVRHPAIVAPVTYADRGGCAAICYPWHAGDVLNHGTASRHIRRDDPASPMFRFRAQPVATVERAIDAARSDDHRADDAIHHGPYGPPAARPGRPGAGLSRHAGAARRHRSCDATGSV